MANVIATVQSINGQAWARDENGNLRELRAGDALTVGETLITAEGSVVSLIFANNEEIQVAGGQSLLMTLNMGSNTVAAEDENTLLDPEVEALLASLSGSGDILESLEAPSAGNSDVSAGGVSSIVQLMRIAEAVDPITFGKIWQLMARGGSIDSFAVDSSEFGYQSSAIAELSSPSVAISSLGNADATVPNITNEQFQVNPLIAEDSNVSASGNEQQQVIDDGNTSEEVNEEELVVDDGGASEEENEEEPVVDDGGASEEENEEEPVVDDGGASEEEKEEEPVVVDGGALEESEEEPVVDDGGASEEEKEEEPVVVDGGALEENEEEPVVDDGGALEEENEEEPVRGEDAAHYQLTLTNYAGDASFNNSFGFYVKDAEGNPTEGMVVWSNVKADAGSDFVLNGYEQKDIGFFIISNGGNKNPSLENETLVNFKQVDGVWQAFAVTQTGEVALNAQDERAPVLFDNAVLNPNGQSYAQDGQQDAGSLNWEDIYINGDGDFNDVNIDVVWQEVIQNNDPQQDVDQPVTVPAVELPTQSIIQGVTGHVTGGSSFLGTLSNAAGLNFSSIAHSHSAKTYVNDQGYLSVDRSGRDKSGAIESKEALLVSLTEEVNSISFDVSGKIGAAKWVAFNADGQQIGSGEWIGLNGVQTFETLEPFKYIAFEGGIKSAFAVKVIGYEDVNGTNVLLGDAENVLSATETTDVLFGGDGEDTFKWSLAEVGGTDTVVDFNLAQGGTLDIADLLPNVTENLDSYLSFKQEGDDAVLQVHAHAPNNAQESIQKVVIKDMNLSALGDTDQEIINSLISSGNLKIDS